MHISKGKIFFLFISKVIRILRIRFAYIFPTIYARSYLYLSGCSYGENLKVCGKVYFRTNQIKTINLGSNVLIISRFLSNTVGLMSPTILECIGDGTISIGDDTGMSSVVISARNKIVIGKNVKIGGNTRIFDHDFHSLDPLHRRKGEKDYLNTKSLPIYIEDDVFIGTNAIILKGVHIGARSIIAAGAVVTIREIPQDSLLIGNPAKIVNYLK